MTRPKLFLVEIETLSGNKAREWVGCTHSPQVAENYQLREREGAFWTWLVGLYAGTRPGW